jgi:mutator protein MutT
MKEKHPENHYKFCPRCASIGEFNSNNFSFKCSICGFHFFLNSAAAVTALIFNEKSEILMVRRGIEPSIGALDLPGGFIDPGESAEFALLREVKEELDLEVDNFMYYGSFPNRYQYSGTIVFTVDFAFKCEIINFENLKFRDDISGIEFWKPEDINLDEVPFQSVRNILTQLINEGNN